MNEFGRIKIEIEDQKGNRTFFADVNGRGLGTVIVGDGGLLVKGFTLKVVAADLATLSIESLPAKAGGREQLEFVERVV